MSEKLSKRELSKIRKTVHESNLRASGMSEKEIREVTGKENYADDPIFR